MYQINSCFSPISLGILWIYLFFFFVFFFLAWKLHLLFPEHTLGQMKLEPRDELSREQFFTHRKCLQISLVLCLIILTALSGYLKWLVFFWKWSRIKRILLTSSSLSCPDLGGWEERDAVSPTSHLPGEFLDACLDPKDLTLCHGVQAIHSLFQTSSSSFEPYRNFLLSPFIALINDL